MNASGRFTESDRLKIVEAIKTAERNTSGEIRLFIEENCSENVLDRAAFIFKELKMHLTKERNGVLIYLAMSSRRFAILGDKGINEKVEKDFWHDIKHEMQNYFTSGDFVTGLTNGIKMTSIALQKYFPYDRNDKNELPDDIVFGKR